MKNTIRGVQISAISASLPSTIIKLDHDFLGIQNDEIEKIKEVTGIQSVRYAPLNVTAADLCMSAALHLKHMNPEYFNDVDGLLFVSQSRDYILPNTSALLQSKLGLAQTCLALDLPSGCAGYIHGLFVASLLISSGCCQRVLLLAGETNSRLISHRDKTVSMIFGDGGSATILSKDPQASLYFNIKTDGSGFEKIIIPHGGCRNPVLANSLAATDRGNGNYRSEVDMYMDGMSVFNFAITEAPRLILETLADLKIDSQDLDVLALHQANLLMVNQISKKCNVAREKAPFSATFTGNTGPASIPILLTDLFQGSTHNLTRSLLCGFGVGLTWGTCFGDLSNASIYAPIFVE